MDEFVGLQSSSGKLIAQWDFKALSEWLDEEGRVFMTDQKEFDFETSAFTGGLIKEFSDALANLELKFYTPGFDDALRQTDALSTDVLLMWESRLSHVKDMISTEITTRKYPPSKGYGPATEADKKAHKYTKT